MLSNALGLPDAIEFEGKQYKIRPLDLEAIALLEEAAVVSASKELDVAKRLVSASQHAMMQERFSDDVLAKQYRYGGQRLSAWIKSLDGMVEAMFLCMKRDNPELDRAFVRRIVESMANKVADKLTKLNKGDEVDPMNAQTILDTIQTMG